MSGLGEESAEIRPGHRRRRGRGAWRSKWPFALALVWASVAVIDLVFVHIGTGHPRPVAARRPTKSSVTAQRPAAQRPAAPGTPSPRPTPGPTHTSGPAAVVLTPVSATAFGPTGPGSGDNASTAALAIDESSATGWRTAWYRSARFGDLQDGTGLLIDMGHAVRITEVQVLLGTTPGADVELLAGNEPALAAMRVSATASDAGGALPLSLHPPGRARYLLIWFTLLPPDSAGTFQADIYNVTIDGTG